MPKLEWDKTGERLYETGVRQCALYLLGEDGTYATGAAWNGITTITESPSGAEATAKYADDIKYVSMMSVEEFGATIEAYTYPEEFGECDGSSEIAKGVVVGQQKRKLFGLSYKTVLGNDVKGTDYAYKLHLIYGCMAAPSEKEYASINDDPDAISMSWELTTTPVSVTGHKPTAQITIDSTKVDATNLKALEDILYGTDTVAARLPLPDEVATLMSASA